MKPISEKNRLKAGLGIVRYLVQDPARAEERFPTGTTFIPVGSEDGQLLVAVEQPANGIVESLERVPAIV